MERVIEVKATSVKTGRELNWKELKKLQEMKLSPKVERVVRPIWEAGPEYKGGSWLFSLVGFFLTPGIITVFIMSTMQKAIGVRLDNVAITAVWLLFICAMVLMALSYAGTLASKDRKLILSRVSMDTWSNKTGKLRRFYGRFNTVVLLGVLAYCGHILTAVVLFFLWIAVICETQAVKQKVQHEIEDIEVKMEK